MKKSGILSLMAGLVLAGSVGIVSAAWNFVDVLNYWNQAGVFSYILPFLLIFALVYAILMKSDIFGDNRGAIIIMALAVGLLALVGDYVPRFFQTIAPALGIGLSVLLAAIILLGLFYKDISWVKNVLVWSGVAIFIVVVYASLSSYNFAGSYLWDQYAPALITLAIIVAAIVAIVRVGKKNP